MADAQTVRARVLMSVVSAVCAVSVVSAATGETRERGFARFGAASGPTSSPAYLIPQFVRAPAEGAPADIEPVGVWEGDLAEFPAMACFSGENPPALEIQAAVNQYMQRFMDRYQIANRWSGTTGSPRALTWSFVPDGLNIPSGVGEPAAPSNLFAQMDAKFGGVANRAVWIAQFQACFDRWAALTGLSYTFVSNNGNQWDDGATWGSTGSAISGQTRGDVRISMKNIDGVNGTLAYNSFPSNGDMVIDSSEGWGSSTNSYRFLRNTVMHEHGHGLGFAHVCPVISARLMEPFLATGFDGPQQDDIRAGIRNYGDAYENNNIIGSATPIGTLGVGTTLNPSSIPAPNVINASITGISVDGDVDFYSVTTAGPVLATITVTPLGTFYQNYTQQAGGACNTGAANVNAAQQANLALDVFTSTGTVMRTASSANLGLAEQLTNVLISGIGNVIRVSETDAPTESQLYSLTVTGVSTPSLTASDSTLSDRVELGWTAITGAASYQVLRNTTNNLGGATVIGTPTTNAFDDTTAVPGTTYFYWVNAVFGSSAILAAGPDEGTRQDSAPSCPADFNLSGQVTVQDIFDFLSAYFSASSTADVNNSGTLTVQDIFDYLALYFTGCP